MSLWASELFQFAAVQLLTWTECLMGLAMTLEQHCLSPQACAALKACLLKFGTARQEEVDGVL
jgi:hypothetical protein